MVPHQPSASDRSERARSGAMGGYHGVGRAAADGAVDRPLRIEELADPPGLRVIGEIDLAGRDVWRSSLASVTAGVRADDVHLDLAALRFIDTAGVSILVHAAGQLGQERKIVLYQPPAVFHRIAEVLWPDHPLSVQPDPV